MKSQTQTIKANRTPFVLCPSRSQTRHEGGFCWRKGFVNPYLKTSLKWIAFAATIAALWMFYGCAPTTKTLFNEFHQAHLAETRTSDKSVDVLVTVRVRAFGNQDEKRAAWCAAWPQFCTPGQPTAGVSVSSEIPEIWTDLRENDGEIVIPAHVLGHEMQHIIKLRDNRVKDPDK